MKKASGIIKAAAVAVLLVSLACLSLVYMNLYRSVDITEFTPKMDRAVRETLYRAEYVGLMDESFISPYFVGYSIDGIRRGFIGGSADDCYGSLRGTVSSLLGADASITKSDASHFDAARNGNFIYVRFRFELPRSVIYYMQNTDMILGEIGDEYIFDMFITSYGRQVTAEARDLRGNYYTLSSENADAINKNDIFEYNDREDGFEFSFICEKPGDAALLSAGKKADDYEILAPDDMTAVSAVVENGKMKRDKDAANALMVLGLNPEKVTSHEGDDGVTYYDEGENVRMGKDGSIIYSALSSLHGIGLADIIGFDFSGGEYTPSDCVGAALVLADKLGLFDTGDFSMAVTCVEKDGGDVTVGISYVYNGITVLTDGGYALKMVVSDGRVTSLSCYFSKAHAYDGTTSLQNGRWSARLAFASGDAPVGIGYAHVIKNSRLQLSLISFEKGEHDK